MQPGQPKILIVGSGPAGLAVALTLLRSNVPVRIIEKDAKFHNGTRGPAVQPRTLEVERYLGILPDTEKFAITGWDIRVYDDKDPYRVAKTRLMAQKVEPTIAFPISIPLLVPQYLHESVYRKHIEALGGKIDKGVSLVGLVQEPDGVAVELVQTVDGVPHTVKEKYDWVVGSDGAHSVVRKSLDIPFVGETRDSERMYIADCKIEGVEEVASHVWGDEQDEKVLVRYTGQPKSFQLLFTGTATDFTALRTKEIAKIQEVITRITKRTDIRITDVTWQGEWRPNIRKAEHFQKGRVYLVGDAAHCHSPAGGQGLNSGIMDAFNLGWKLALAAKGHASAQLLTSYEAERSPVISEMINISTSLHDQNLAADLATGAGAHDHPRPKQDANPRNRRLFQLDVNYRWSPIVLDERFNDEENVKQPPDAYGFEGHDLRAGDRAPDAPDLLVLMKATGSVISWKQSEGQRTRFFDIYAPDRHTVVVFGAVEVQDRSLAVLQYLQKLPAGLARAIVVLPQAAHVEGGGRLPTFDLALHDVSGHAFREYGLLSDAMNIVVVRPDGVIGAFVKGAEGVEKYFNTIIA